MSVSPFVESQTFESLRVSDFDCYSAYGEVIDNSIQANALNVRVYFIPHEADPKYIGRVVFIDDGDGMNHNLLQNCLRLGYSSRYGDRSGIGRFGVGMTLGAIHECRRIEVYSKQRSSEWLYTYLDLDEVTEASKKGESWKIPAPESRSPGNSNTISQKAKDHLPEHGTIVIWDTYDNRAESLEKAKQYSSVWFGRTFRYYMCADDQNPRGKENPVTLWIDNKKVPVIDPLWLRLESSDFADDDLAQEYTPISFNWPINNPELEGYLGRKDSTVTIRFSLYPVSLRDKQGAGGSNSTKERSIDENEGFSFVRHGREVGYGWIPRFQFQAKELDRFWGCEILFEPELDTAFTVKNIKRGAAPLSELKKTIEEKIGPTIKAARQKISDHWKSNEVSKPSEGGEKLKPVERIGKDTKLPPGKLFRDKPIEELVKKGAKGNTEVAARLRERFKDQPFILVEDTWPVPAFMEISHAAGKDLLKYNLNHAFYDVIKNIRSEIEKGEQLELNSERLSTLIDVLLIAYAKSESMLKEGEAMPPEAIIELIKSNWGMYLMSYIQTWRKQFDSLEAMQDE